MFAFAYKSYCTHDRKQVLHSNNYQLECHHARNTLRQSHANSQYRTVLGPNSDGTVHQGGNIWRGTHYITQSRQSLSILIQACLYGLFC